MVKIRVFCPKERHMEIEKMMKVGALYDAFVIGEAQAAQIKLIRGKFPVEEMSSRSIDVRVTGSEIPLKITLVWTDYPGQGLINNLNPSRYYGNAFEPPFDTSLDTQNNVETVFLQNPTVGIYKIEVMGSNIAKRSQDYALVYSAILE